MEKRYAEHAKYFTLSVEGHIDSGRQRGGREGREREVGTEKRGTRGWGARQASKPPEAMNILQWGSVTDFKAALLS